MPPKEATPQQQPQPESRGQKRPLEQPQLQTWNDTNSEFSMQILPVCAQLSTILAKATDITLPQAFSIAQQILQAMEVGFINERKEIVKDNGEFVKANATNIDILKKMVADFEASKHQKIKTTANNNPTPKQIQGQIFSAILSNNLATLVLTFSSIPENIKYIEPCFNDAKHPECKDKDFLTLAVEKRHAGVIALLIRHNALFENPTPSSVEVFKRYLQTSEPELQQAVIEQLIQDINALEAFYSLLIEYGFDNLLLEKMHLFQAALTPAILTKLPEKLIAAAFGKTGRFPKKTALLILQIVKTKIAQTHPTVSPILSTKKQRIFDSTEFFLRRYDGPLDSFDAIFQLIADPATTPEQLVNQLTEFRQLFPKLDLTKITYIARTDKLLARDGDTLLHAAVRHKHNNFIPLLVNIFGFGIYVPEITFDTIKDSIIDNDGSWLDFLLTTLQARNVNLIEFLNQRGQNGLSLLDETVAHDAGNCYITLQKFGAILRFVYQSHDQEMKMLSKTVGKLANGFFALQRQTVAQLHQMQVQQTQQTEQINTLIRQVSVLQTQLSQLLGPPMPVVAKPDDDLTLAAAFFQSK
jgi:uncharacterized protein YdhG (YjbR/CyaY superfamily)